LAFLFCVPSKEDVLLRLLDFDTFPVDFELSCDGGRESLAFGLTVTAGGSHSSKCPNSSMFLLVSTLILAAVSGVAARGLEGGDLEFPSSPEGWTLLCREDEAIESGGLRIPDGILGETEDRTHANEFCVGVGGILKLRQVRPLLG